MYVGDLIWLISTLLTLPIESQHCILHRCMWQAVKFVLIRINPMHCLCTLSILQRGYLPSPRTPLWLLLLGRPSPHPIAAVWRGPPEEGLHLEQDRSASRSPLMTTMLCGEDWQHRNLSGGKGTHVRWCQYAALLSVLKHDCEWYKWWQCAACGVCCKLCTRCIHIVYVWCMYSITCLNPYIAQFNWYKLYMVCLLFSMVTQSDSMRYWLLVGNFQLISCL